MTQQDKAHELSFWEGFTKTERFIKGWCNNERTPELREQVYIFLKSILSPEMRIADVGSGVVSILTGTVPKDQLYPIDPLGDEYGAIFNYKDYPETKQPATHMAEDLPFENTFDIVHISNALDHTQDIKKAFQSLFKAVKPGGYLIIQGFENEGTHENWQGFHQNDVYLTCDKNLYSKQKNDREFLITEGNFEIIEASLTKLFNRNWIIWIAQKQ